MNPIRPWPSRILLLDAVILVSLVALVYGLVRGDVLAPHGWTALTVNGFAAAVAGSLVALVVAGLLQRRFKVSGDAWLGCALALLAACVFGPAAVLCVGLLLAGGLIVGTAILGAGARDDGWPVAQRVAVGLAVAAIVATALAPLRVNFAPLQVGLLLAMAAPLASPRLRARLGRDWREALATMPGPGRMAPVWRAFGVFVAAFFMLQAALPERYHDALAVHLFVASHMAAQGAWSFDPELYAFALMPMAADFLSAHLFAFAGEPAVKLFNYAAFLITALLVRGSVGRRFGGEAGAIAGMLFASMPLTLVETASVFIENPLALWITAAAAILLEKGRALDARAVAGVLTALAAASLTKLHGALASVFLGGLMLVQFASVRRAPPEWARFLALALAGAAVALSAYVFAWAVSGNPVLPFFNDVFKSPNFADWRFADSRWIGRFTPDLLYRATFASQNFLEAQAGALGFGLLAFLGAGLAAAALFEARLRGLALVFLGFVVAVGVGTQYLRYFYPVLPIAFLVIGFAASLYLARPRAGLLFRGLAVAVLCLNLYKMPAAGWILPNNDFSILFDRERALRFERSATPDKALLKVVNDLAGRSARVLLSGTSTAAPLAGTAIYSSWYAKAFWDLGSSVKTPADLDAYLRSVRPTHILHRAPPDKTYAFHGVLDAEIERVGRRIATLGAFTLYEARLP